MNIPKNKEEIDSILFELLEGNLSKEEENFWHDYASKNNEFGRQLAIFRKTYLSDNLSAYPDHSHMIIRKTSGFFTKKLFLSLLSILTVASITAVLVFQSSKKTDKNEDEKKAISEEGQTQLKTTSVPCDTPKVHAHEAVKFKQVEKKEKVLVMAKTKMTHQDTLPHHVPIEEKIQTHPKVDSTAHHKTKEEQTLIVEEKKTVEQSDQTQSTSSPKIEAQKTPKNDSKLNIKPSKKTRTSDFNY